MKKISGKILKTIAKHEPELLKTIIYILFFSEDSSIVLPLSISDPCSGTLHFSLEVKKSSDVDPVTNVANAAAASGNSPASPDSKLQYLTKATLFPSGGIRRKVDSTDHNKVMSLAR